MVSLNKLEKAVLEAICKQVSADASALKTQVKGVTVEKRNNTGVGFYTNMKVYGAVDKIETRVFPAVFAHIEGMENPMSFILFTKNGFVDVLEGAATEDSTINIDFSTVRFDAVSNSAELR